MKQYEKDEYQAYLDSEKATIIAIKKTYEDALEQVDEKIRVLSTRTDIENMPTIIHQQKYQLQLKEQLEGILDKLQEKQYKTVNDYLNECYSESFLRTMYSLNQQGIPFVWPIDQKAVERAVVLDSKISGGLYTHLGVDVQSFKKSISSEISRGIASSLSYSEIARNLKNASKVPISNTSRIVRTEGHRIQNQAKLDTMNEAKKKGADVVKQWDATLDGNTRPTHRQLDGQIREIDEDFEVDGMTASAPGMFGDPAEDCNCRCAVLQRAKWALDESELETLQKRAEYYGLDKTDDFNDFKEKYMKAADEESKGADSGSVRSDVQKINKVDTVHTQEYKPVTLDSNDVKNMNRGEIEIKSNKILNTNNDLYVSDRVSLKPKQLHTIDNNISSTLNVLGLERTDKLPTIMIINNAEMQTGAMAAYNPIKNVLYIDENIGILDKLKEIQKDCACPDSPLSTFAHEYIHFMDSAEYQSKFGKISTDSDYYKYIDWINEKSKKKLDKLEEMGYNVNEISMYAKTKYESGEFNETYTEYRVKKKLKE